MLTYFIVIIQVISIIAIAYILRYMFNWKPSLTVSFGLIAITYVMFKTSIILNIQFTLLEWFLISFVNSIGWHMCFYCKEERSFIGIAIMLLTPVVVLGSMF